MRILKKIIMMFALTAALFIPTTVNAQTPDGCHRL